MTFHLDGHASIAKIEDFQKYLLSDIPPQIADIKIEGQFESGSQVLLVTMPAPVWPTLREDDNITFIAHVRSSDMLLDGPPKPEQQPRSLEKVPPQVAQASTKP